MWIFLSIVAFFVISIALLLLSPLHIIIKNDSQNNLVLKLKCLFFTFDSDKKPKKKTSVTKLLKKGTGIDKFDKNGIKALFKDKEVKDRIALICQLIKNILSEISNVLKYVTAKKFKLNVVCCADNAANSAIRYGECCALVYPLMGFISSLIKIKAKNTNVDIKCAFEDEKESIIFNFVLSVPLFRLVAALFRIAFKLAKRSIKNK